LGDFIQSIAAKSMDATKNLYAIDRDQLHRYQGPNQLNCNEWMVYGRSHKLAPFRINSPLFISFHLNPTAERDAYPQGDSYFKKTPTHRM
jgi:hypothetical protein